MGEGVAVIAEKDREIESFFDFRYSQPMLNNIEEFSFMYRLRGECLSPILKCDSPWPNL